MKKLFFLLSLFLTGAVVFGAPAPRSISIGSKPIFRLTKDNCLILIPPDACKVVQFAAQELQEQLSRVLGGTIPVGTMPRAGKSHLRLGLTPEAKNAGLDPAKLARDGFYIKTAGKDVFIGGIDDPKVNPPLEIKRGGGWSMLYEKGTVYGVYDFLERFAGVRFYFPGELGTIAPPARELNIPAIDIIDRPDFTVRSFSPHNDGTYFEGEKRDAIINPRKNLNIYRYRYQTQYMPCCHGVQGFGFVHRFGKSHPEYFALTSNNRRYNDPNLQFPGQICWTSNIREELYQDLKSYFTGRPPEERGMWWNNRHTWAFPFFRKPYVDIMPQDSFLRCHCKNCEAAYNEGKYYATELVWGNVVTWANRLTKEGIEGQLNMMAYPPYRGIPKVEIPRNVNVMVAETGPWIQDPAKIAEQDGEIKAWVKKLGRKVWLWNYANKHSSLAIKGVPAPTPRAVARYYTRVAPYIFGAFMESECDRFLYFYLNFYIFSKVAWNNQCDWKGMLDEHYKLMFGPASAVMQKVMERFEDIWLKQIYGRTVDTAVGPISAVPSDYDLWHKVYSPAVIAQIAADFDQAAKLVKKGSLEARRIEMFRRELLDPLNQAAKDYLARTNAVGGVFARFGGDPIHLIPFRTAKGVKPELVDTKVSVNLTEKALEITFECEEPRFGETCAVKRKFDDPDTWKDNSVEIFLNPTGDRKNYYQFIINTKGTLTDSKWYRPGKSSQHDGSWNSNAAVSVAPIKGGFRITAAIPLSSLPGLKRTGFPANFGRNRVLQVQGKAQVLYTWSRYAKGFHDLENYGMLVPCRKELLYDPGFDKVKLLGNRHWGFNSKGGKYTGWYANTPTATNFNKLDNTEFFSAPCSMKLVSGDPAKGATVNQFLSGKLKPNTTYRVSFKVKLQNVVKMKNSASGFCVNMWDDANRWFPRGRWLDGTMDWTYLSFTHKTSAKVADAKVSYIGARLMNCTGTAWVDDLSMEEIE